MKKAKNILNSNNLLRFVMITAVIMVVIAIFVVIHHSFSSSCPENLESRSVVMVTDGDTLSKLLLEQGFSNNDVLEIAQVLKKEAGVSTLHADSDRFEFVRSAENAPVNKIVITPSPWHRIEMTYGQSGSWKCQNVDIQPDIRIVHKNGEIRDGDSFYYAGERAGIPAGILIDVYDLLAFEMDFERDIRAGQKFSVLYEENFSNGKKVNNGRVLAVWFQALRGDVKMYRFRKSDGKIGYYDENGNGAIKSLKRTPINNARVTSSFSLHRKHPVLGFTRAHKGVDFRASTGTPIPAAGAGRVVARGYNRGHGNYVKIRHNGTFETLYAHMSRFARGVTVGTSVRQGQVIGYVGATGLATGPHLHYEVIKNGKHVNPMTVKLPAIDNLNAADKKEFLKYRQILDKGVEKLSENPDWFISL